MSVTQTNRGPAASAHASFTTDSGNEHKTGHYKTMQGRQINRTQKYEGILESKEGFLKRPPSLQENDLDGWWQLRPGARLPSEAELRRMLSPDQWCMYDTTKTGNHRLWEQGISKYETLVQIPAERMQIAIEQLPEVCSSLYIEVYGSQLSCSPLCYATAARSP